MDNEYFLRLHANENLQYLGFHDIAPLRSGAFGEVFSAISPRKEKVAIKLIKKEFVWEIEKKIWPILQHANILPVMNLYDMNDLGMCAFITPLHFTSLDQILGTTDFLNDVCSLRRVKFWLRDVLSALDYLHTAGFCHLDVKNDNVLISREDSAILCDFSGINLASMEIERLCSPYENRPPECFQNSGKCCIRGVPFDIWTFGLMSLNVLTGHEPARHMMPVTNQGWTWNNGVEPVLAQCLEIENFYYLMRKAFPRVPFSSEEALHALSFAVVLMSWNPDGRPTAEESIKHSFLKVRESFPSMGDAEIHHLGDRPAYGLTAGQKLFGLGVQLEECIEPTYESGDSNNQGVRFVSVNEGSVALSPECAIRFYNEGEQVHVVPHHDSAVHESVTDSRDEDNFNLLVSPSYLENDELVEDKRHDCMCDQPMAFRSVFENFGSRDCLAAENSPIVFKETKKCLPKEKVTMGKTLKRWFKKKWNQAVHKKMRYKNLSSED